MADKHRLSMQAIGTFMLILTKGILEEVDMTELFENLDFIIDDNNELVCLNPPKIEFHQKEEIV
jgi:hypothetical protein